MCVILEFVIIFTEIKTGITVHHNIKEPYSFWNPYVLYFIQSDGDYIQMAECSDSLIFSTWEGKSLLYYKEFLHSCFFSCMFFLFVLSLHVIKSKSMLNDKMQIIVFYLLLQEVDA